jgi:hypothetical protein
VNDKVGFAISASEATEPTDMSEWAATIPEVMNINVAQIGDVTALRASYSNITLLQTANPDAPDFIGWFVGKVVDDEMYTFFMPMTADYAEHIAEQLKQSAQKLRTESTKVTN